MGAGWAATATAWASSLASGLVGEVGAAMDPRFKETAMGGTAATPTAQAIARQIWPDPTHLRYEDPPE